ncbi:periplasmic heavy metal sensor [Thalassobius sp. Cn5-15]|jgi:uncharacterized membrane protein|uniref:periplasmic heavy metal sensor n=1 Tax=Thalassobius sp. Cn5-15 TaxID=2917763 RepID=UPI001EF3C078|nr:periplasmic heavy metal sensor [Thalassobius sp. Cn5-15]MCG7494294.1 periplasmic heavy metal sensor [Thalassobius sp. Cn5-15]
MAQESPKAQPVSKPKLWLRVLLFASLALNLAVLGIVAGAFLRFGGPDSDKRPVQASQIAGAYTHALTPADRRAIWHDMRRQSADLPSRTSIRQSHNQVLQLLRRDPLDRDALAQVLRQQIAFGHARAEMGQALLIEHLSDMDAAERAAYADRLEEALKKRKGGSKGSKGGKPSKDGRPPKPEGMRP